MFAHRYLILKRPLKIYYCPPRPNDSWPPKTDGVTSIQPRKPQTSNQLSEKPANCTKLYCGNLSYNIGVQFFKTKSCNRMTLLDLSILHNMMIFLI